MKHFSKNLKPANEKFLSGLKDRFNVLGMQTVDPTVPGGQKKVDKWWLRDNEFLSTRRPSRVERQLIDDMAGATILTRDTLDKYLERRK